MSRAVFALLLCFPSPVLAAGTGASEFSFFSSLLQTIAALAIVVGLIFVARHYSDKLFKALPAGRFTSKHIRLIETRYIAPKKSLLLIEVSGEYLLLSSSGDNLTLIKQIDMLEEIEVIEEPEQRVNFFSLFRR